VSNQIAALHRKWTRLFEDYNLGEKYDPEKHELDVLPWDALATDSISGYNTRRQGVKSPSMNTKDLWILARADAGRLAFVVAEKRRYYYGGEKYVPIFALRHNSFTVRNDAPRVAWIITRLVPFLDYAWDASRMRWDVAHDKGMWDRIKDRESAYISRWVLNSGNRWWTIKNGSIQPIRRPLPEGLVDGDTAERHWTLQRKAFDQSTKDRKARYARREKAESSPGRRRREGAVQVADAKVSVKEASIHIAALLSPEQPAKSTPRKEVRGGNNVDTETGTEQAILATP